MSVMLNLLVIAANGGFMPISPDTLTRLNPGASPDPWETSTHRHHSKGIVLMKAETCFWVLSDILVLPPPFPLPTAFSIGDVFIAGGAFLLLQKAMGDDSSGQEQGSGFNEGRE